MLSVACFCRVVSFLLSSKMTLPKWSWILLFQANGLVHKLANLTWMWMKRWLRKSLFFEDAPYVLEESKQVAAFHLLHQIRLIMVEHFDTIIPYRTTFSSGNENILSAAENLDYRDPLILHLHFSADGGQLYQLFNMYCCSQQSLYMYKFHVFIMNHVMCRLNVLFS